jgi:hypothetical protein
LEILEAPVVEITMLEGARINIPIEPRSSHPAEAKRLFDRAAQTVQSEWKKRRELDPGIGPGGRKKKRDLRWLKVTAYIILKEMIFLELDDVFEQRIRQYRRYPRGERGRPNRFQMGLLALFAEDAKALSSSDRQRIGKLLDVAYRHYVRPEFLIGFLAQYEGSSRDELLPGTDLLRDFGAWIAECRAEPGADDDRYDYPADIEREVEVRQGRRLAEQDDHWDDD